VRLSSGAGRNRWAPGWNAHLKGLARAWEGEGVCVALARGDARRGRARRHRRGGGGRREGGRRAPGGRWRRRKTLNCALSNLACCACAQLLAVLYGAVSTEKASMLMACCLPLRGAAPRIYAWRSAAAALLRENGARASEGVAKGVISRLLQQTDEPGRWTSKACVLLRCNGGRLPADGADGRSLPLLCRALRHLVTSRMFSAASIHVRRISCILLVRNGWRATLFQHSSYRGYLCRSDALRAQAACAALSRCERCFAASGRGGRSIRQPPSAFTTSSPPRCTHACCRATGRPGGARRRRRAAHRRALAGTAAAAAKEAVAQEHAMRQRHACCLPACACCSTHARATLHSHCCLSHFSLPYADRRHRAGGGRYPRTAPVAARWALHLLPGLVTPFPACRAAPVYPRCRFRRLYCYLYRLSSTLVFAIAGGTAGCLPAVNGRFDGRRRGRGAAFYACSNLPPGDETTTRRLFGGAPVTPCRSRRLLSRRFTACFCASLLSPCASSTLLRRAYFSLFYPPAFFQPALSATAGRCRMRGVAAWRRTRHCCLA